MATRQYSVDRVSVAWFGVDLTPGLAAGTSITEARNAVSWTNKPTGMGGVVRVYNPDRSGTVTITVDQESSTHQLLRELAQQDVIARNVVGAMTIKDTSSDESFYYSNAYIATEPDETRGTESTTFAWQFNFERVEHTVAINQNIVP